ncbi:hypothetical protein D3C72_2248300 [compost metagenome]
MAARLQRDISCAPLRLTCGHIERMHLGVAGSPLQMCTQADHSPVFYDHAADDRVDASLSLRSFRHIQCERHIKLVVHDIHDQPPILTTYLNAIQPYKLN